VQADPIRAPARAQDLILRHRVTIDRSRDLRADMYDVYAAALDSFPATRTTSPIISSRTWRYSLSRALGDTSDFYRSVQADSDVGGRLLSVFDSLNTTSAELCACFPKRARVTLVADTLGAGVAGPFVVSRVAFSPDQVRALVAIGHSCGALCGSQALYPVVRDRRGWHVGRTLLSGVS
jgi:hypothetical protein